jgi:hypothetical protein
MPSDQDTYSIQVRLRRTCHEDAFVSVPVTDAIVDRQPDGTGRINPKALVAAAMQISKDPRVEWKRESMETTMHPVQCPLPEGRSSFDAFYAGGQTE